MPAFRAMLTAALIAGFAATGIAVAQTVPAPDGVSAQKTEGTRVSRKEWRKMQRKWRKENRAKYQDCRKQARDQNLRGRERRSAVISCMGPS